ncbi:hypothetical protein Cyagr_1934 [Cyanobium gracile PCC 6307]|uniref:Uncharacterized protein n=2 Tax=Cyanobium gracile TaxID=59930 RepID=K9P7X2_CYAGP|nr:hypothetical protein Cyagr_1934 [Cyanobium gracile PCC 6307]
MSFSRFPTDPEALFSAAHDAYDNIGIHEKKRNAITDKINKLSQDVPVPIDRLWNLKMQLSDLNDNIRQLSREAEILVNAAIRGLISSSDVENASSALKCANGKAALALNSLAQFDNFLAVSTAYVDFVSALAKAAASAPASLLAISEIIDSFQKLVSLELQETLTEEELKRIRNELAVDCVKIV